MVSNYITVPILAVDAIFLAMAAKATGTILDWGVLNFNQGHLSLLALTITGASLWAWPQLLNPFIPLYRAITKPFKRQLE